MPEERMLQVGVKAVIQNDQDKILLLKNSKVWPGQTEPVWDAPGGRINIGETLADALRREVKEESGLDLANIERILGAQEILRPHLHVVRITYLATATGKLVLNHSDDSDTTHTDAQWFSQSELNTLSVDQFLSQLLPQVWK